MKGLGYYVGMGGQISNLLIADLKAVGKFVDNIGGLKSLGIEEISLLPEWQD